MHVITHLAYIDTGTGSLVIQSIVGVAAGVGVFGRRAISNFGHKVRNIFSKTDNK